MAYNIIKDENDKLLKHKCIPCEGGIDPLKGDEITKLMPQVPGWVVSEDEKKLSKEFKFKDFIGSINFINKVAEIAEEEGHHPDIDIHYNKVKITNWTHAINGLSENDFILAAKIDATFPA